MYLHEFIIFNPDAEEAFPAINRDSIGFVVFL